MSLNYIICSKFHDNREHALYSTRYGHKMAKSRLEGWIHRTNIHDIFECPICRTHSLGRDCHPIFNLPLKLLKKGLNNRSTHFVETEHAESKENRMMDFYDTLNRYILVAVIGYYEADKPPSVLDIDFPTSLEQICKGMDILYYTISGTGFFTTIVFNKFREDAVEFCIGLKSGSIKKVVITPTKGICRAPNDNIVVNKDNRINSTCFFDKNKVFGAILV